MHFSDVLKAYKTHFFTNVYRMREIRTAPHLSYFSGDTEIGPRYVCVDRETDGLGLNLRPAHEKRRVKCLELVAKGTPIRRKPAKAKVQS